jgi:8-oxo-dGTP pyrophosphatase MutT (NUDIX family)
LSNDYHFDQSAVIPYRVENGSAEILLITSIRKKRWIVPKGFIEFNLSAFESAKKEAFEEAGILGTNETEELGTFTMEKYGGELSIKVFSMEVVEEHEDYAEKNLRKKKWFSVKDAAEKISIPEIAELILKLGKKVAKG